jgi:hypothetical protein
MAGTGEGSEIPFMREAWPNARIIGVDPLPQHAKVWDKYPERKPDVFYPVGLGTHQCEATLHLNYEPDQRASLFEMSVPLENERLRKVQIWTLGMLYDATEPWPNCLMWLDAEGSEYDILNYYGRLLKTVNWLNVEVAWLPPRVGIPRFGQIDRLLEQYGFLCVGVHTIDNHRQADAVYVRTAEWEAKRDLICRKAIERKLERLDLRRQRREARSHVKDGDCDTG